MGVYKEGKNWKVRWSDRGLTRSPANYPQTGLKFLSYTLPASTRV